MTYYYRFGQPAWSWKTGQSFTRWTPWIEVPEDGVISPLKTGRWFQTRIICSMDEKPHNLVVHLK